jgi:thioesterase domain-containing protein
MGGHVASFGPLARGLTEPRTVYGLQGHGLEAGRQPHNRIEDMAAAYLAEIQEVQPSGPYLLAGWSMGGLIALEAARRLIATGEEVPFVAMFDTGFSAEDVPAKDMDENSVMRCLAPRLKIPVAELKKLPLGRQWEWIASQANLIGGEGAAEICRLAEVCRAHLAALAAYSPECYPGPAVLFQALPGDGLDSRWESLCPRLRVERVPGNHYTMLRHPHVEVLAERLGRCLAEAVEAAEVARAP